MKVGKLRKLKCFKCKKVDSLFGSRVICIPCKIMIHDKCIDTLDVINLRISFIKDSHSKCNEQVDIA